MFLNSLTLWNLPNHIKAQNLTTVLACRQTNLSTSIQPSQFYMSTYYTRKSWIYQVYFWKVQIHSSLFWKHLVLKKRNKFIILFILLLNKQVTFLLLESPLHHCWSCQSRHVGGIHRLCSQQTGRFPRSPWQFQTNAWPNSWGASPWQLRWPPREWGYHCA